MGMFWFCFLVSNCMWRHFVCSGRRHNYFLMPVQAGWASGPSIFLRCLCLYRPSFKTIVNKRLCQLFMSRRVLGAKPFHLYTNLSNSHFIYFTFCKNVTLSFYQDATSLTSCFFRLVIFLLFLWHLKNWEIDEIIIFLW
jgi:hypothetical protein